MTNFLSLLIAILLHLIFFFFFDRGSEEENQIITPPSLEITSVQLSFGDEENSDKQGENAEKPDPLKVQTEREEIVGSIEPALRVQAGGPDMAPPVIPDIDAVSVATTAIRETHGPLFPEPKESAHDLVNDIEPDWEKQWELNPEQLPEARVIVKGTPDPNSPSTAQSSSSPENSAAGEVHTTLIAKSAIQPAYPLESRKRNEEGTVVLSVKVSSAGKPISVKLKKSSGYKRLDQSAMKAVSRASFHPAMRGKKSIESEFSLMIEFKLNDQKSEKK